MLEAIFLAVIGFAATMIFVAMAMFAVWGVIQLFRS